MSGVGGGSQSNSIPISNCEFENTGAGGGGAGSKFFNLLVNTLRKPDVAQDSQTQPKINQDRSRYLKIS